jgi:hypothetical protein
MSWVQEAPQIVQDLIVPELRSLGVKLDNLEKRVEAGEKRADERFAAMEKRADERFAQSEKRADERFAAMEKRADEREQRTVETLREVKGELAAMRMQLDLQKKLESLTTQVNEMRLSREQH